MPRGGQRTFVSVPNPLGMQGLIDRANAADEVRSLPPMTSKQAKKLAQKKNKELNKKMSKEEERRLKLEALSDAIKKEERAKREKKAAMAREKKLQKEQKRVEERKSKGMPLIDVRPSQDTITNFLRGNGTNKKRDSTGAQLEAVQEETETPEPGATTAAGNKMMEEQGEPQQPLRSLPSPIPAAEDTKQVASTKPFKRFRTGCTPRKEDKRAKVVSESNSNIPSPNDATAISPEHRKVSIQDSLAARAPEPTIETEPADKNLDDPDKSLAGLVVDELLDDGNQAVQPRSPVRSLPVKTNLKTLINKENEPTTTPPARLQDTHTGQGVLRTSSQRKALLSISGNGRREPNQQTPSQHTFVDARGIPLSATRRPSNYRSPKPQAMPPPPVPVRRNGSQSSNSEAQTTVPKPLHTPVPRPLLRQATHSSARCNDEKAGMVTPTCTQLLNISTDDLADFLPTPSQEVREIQGEYARPAIPPSAKPPVRVPDQPARQIKPPMRKPPPPMWKPAVSATPLITKAPSLPTCTLPPIDLASLLSTQDLSFSSQDIRELDETPCRLPVKPTVDQASRPADDNKASDPPHGRFVAGACAIETDKTQEMIARTSTTRSEQHVTTNDTLYHSPHVDSSQLHSALSQAARYRKRPPHSSTPQLQLSMHSSAGVSQETPCRAAGPPSRPKTVPYASRYASSAARRQSVTSTPAAQPTPVTALSCTSQQVSKKSASPANSASLPCLEPVSILQPVPDIQGVNAITASPKPSRSPPKQRFLTSSNVEMTLAMERSRKTFQEEQKKRELKEREDELARREEERRQRVEREAEDHYISADGTDFWMDDYIDDVEEEIGAQHKSTLEKALSQQVYAAISQGKRHKSDVDIVVSATQETDYGDFDILFATQPFRTQVFLARGGSQVQKRDHGTGPGNASQETDYGELDLDVDDVEKFLDQVDFSDDDYP